MKSYTVKYYDWFEHIQPELLKTITETLASQGIAPPPDGFRGGYFKDGQWVDTGEGEYIDYWHVYLNRWGEHIRNGSYVNTYFPPNDPEEWDQHRYDITKEYGSWAVVVLDAVYKMLVDHKIYDQHGEAEMLIWFGW
jgi:hypothetical protein